MDGAHHMERLAKASGAIDDDRHVRFHGDLM
jgi:hypothetical protein